MQPTDADTQKQITNNYRAFIRHINMRPAERLTITGRVIVRLCDYGMRQCSSFFDLASIEPLRLKPLAFVAEQAQATLTATDHCLAEIERLKNAQPT